MWIIEMCRSDIRKKWFKIWDSEVADEPEKRGPLYCADYLKLCVENEQGNKTEKKCEYRILYVPKS